MKNYTKSLKYRSFMYNISFVIFAGFILYFLGRNYLLSLSETEFIITIGAFVLWAVIFLSKMKLSSYVFVSLVASLVFYLNEISNLWIPLMLFISGFLSDLLNSSTSFYIFKKRNYTNILGKFAILLDFIVTSFGVLAMIGQFFLIIFLIYWWLF